MAVRVKGLLAFVTAVFFIFMTLNSIFPRRGDRSDITAHVNPHEAATTTEAAAGDGEGMPALADQRIHDNGHHTTTTHHTPDQQPTSPIAEWDVIDPADRTRQDVSTTASRNRPTPDDHSSNTDFRILIGVMNPFQSALRRQIMRNAYSQFPKDLPFDIWFVMGDIEPWNPDNAEKVRDTSQLARDWENSTYGDIMGLDCFENMEEGKTYEYLKKVGLDFSDRYTHVMKTDDDSFVNIPALLQVIHEHKDEPHLYWGATYTDGRFPAEMWGSGYLLSMDLVKWISRSEIPLNNTIGLEDLQVAEWLVDGGLHDNAVNNFTAFGGYPWPELGDHVYKQENEIRPFDRWTLVTHPLKENFMWIDTATWYLNLRW